MASDPGKVQRLFLKLIEQSAQKRREILDQECADDSETRQRIEALLAANDEPNSYLDRSNDAGEATYVPVTKSHVPQKQFEPGVEISEGYTLREKIGEGGMGEVWVAKQSHPVNRKVALKLIKTGMDTKAVLRRFEYERQALAIMDHPNIAKVFAAGQTITGQPFFVMELVNGLPLDKFCDQTRMGVKERLKLFIPICQAIQHAHQKGIVHRDLKPANILVTMIDGTPVPKVIDFGVAKAVGGGWDEETMTQFGAIVGTLEYMAPEQTLLSGEDIDTRADIYSLGVILYEMLTGLRPIDGNRLRAAAITEMLRIIKEEEPSKPSTRLSTNDSLPSLAAFRGIEPRKLMALLRGELDWVVMKCLEKKRDRRYDSATALMRDLQRYLSDEPVEARPPSAGYRLQKFLKRHKGPAVAGSMTLLVLLGGIAGTTWGLLEAKEQEKKAIFEAGLKEDARRAEKERADGEEKAKRKAIVEKERADRQLLIAETANYAIQLKLADILVDDDAPAMARELLEKTKPEFRRSEFYRVLSRVNAREQTFAQGRGYSAADLSADGKLVALGGRGGIVELFDSDSGQRIRTVECAGSRIECLQFSPNARVLACGTDTSIQVWDVASGKQLGKTDVAPTPPEFHDDPSRERTSLAFNATGERLAVGLFGTLQVWNGTLTEQECEIKTVPGYLKSVAFDPQRNRIASYCFVLKTNVEELPFGLNAKPPKLIVFDLDQKTVHREVDFNPGGSSGNAAYDPMGRWLVTVGIKTLGPSAGIDFRDPETLEVIESPLKNFNSETASAVFGLSHVQFSATGETLMLVDRVINRRAFLLDLTSGELKHTVNFPDTINRLGDVDFFEEGQYLIAAAGKVLGDEQEEDGWAKRFVIEGDPSQYTYVRADKSLSAGLPTSILQNSRKGWLIHPIKKGIIGDALFEDGKPVIDPNAHYQDEVLFASLSTGEPLFEAKFPDTEILSTAVTSDDLLLMSVVIGKFGTDEATQRAIPRKRCILVWDPATRRTLREFELPDKDFRLQNFVVHPTRQEVIYQFDRPREWKMNPETQEWEGRGQVIARNYATGEVLWEVSTGKYSLKQLAYDPQGETVVFLHSGMRADPEKRNPTTGEPFGVNYGVLELRDAKSGKLQATSRELSSDITEVLPDADGDVYFSATTLGLCRWNRTSGEITTISDMFRSSLFFEAGGKRIIGIEQPNSSNPSIVWLDTVTFQELYRFNFNRNGGDKLHLDISPDGSWIVCGQRMGTVVLKSQVPRSTEVGSGG